jgi:ABC-type polysaccharide/polyol phosphate transport system ATPase subunit
MSEHAIEVDGLGKAYRIYPSPGRRVLEWISLGAHRGHHEFWALRGVSFALGRGASLGLCGANGAGKSTLLKVLAGTTRPTEGRYRINGRVASLLELGAGFHADFSGRANIFMNGIMMGFTRREMQSKLDEIIAFAELGSYIDEPVRTYSSGMGLRLGFSIAVAVDPDVLMIDEVFAVGDMYFQKKCIDRIYDFKKRGKTIVFCSHSLYDIRQLCDEALWLNGGKPGALGSSVHVTNEYASFQRTHIDEAKKNISAQFGGRAIEAEPSAERKPLPRIVDARVYRDGKECYEIATGDSIEIRVWWENPRPAETPVQIGVGFMRQDMTTCGGIGSHLDGVELRGNAGCAIIKLPDVHLLSGQFLLPVILFDREGVHKYQEFLLPENLVVRANTREVGLFRLDHAWELRTDVPRPEARKAS